MSICTSSTFIGRVETMLRKPRVQRIPELHVPRAWGNHPTCSRWWYVRSVKKKTSLSLPSAKVEVFPHDVLEARRWAVQHLHHRKPQGSLPLLRIVLPRLRLALLRSYHRSHEGVTYVIDETNKHCGGKKRTSKKSEDPIWENRKKLRNKNWFANEGPRQYSKTSFAKSVFCFGEAIYRYFWPYGHILTTACRLKRPSSDNAFPFLGPNISAICAGPIKKCMILRQRPAQIRMYEELHYTGLTMC